MQPSLLWIFECIFFCLSHDSLNKLYMSSFIWRDLLDSKDNIKYFQNSHSNNRKFSWSHVTNRDLRKWYNDVTGDSLIYARTESWENELDYTLDARRFGVVKILLNNFAYSMFISSFEIYLARDVNNSFVYIALYIKMYTIQTTLFAQEKTWFLWYLMIYYV